MLNQLRMIKLRGYLVRQYDRSDCGPAALLSMLRFWGGDAPLSLIREIAGTDVSGTPFVGLLRAARALGFEARGARGSYESLVLENHPFIAHLVLDDGTPHYVVCESVATDSVRIGDPMEGRRKVPRGTFERWWKSRAILLLDPTPQLRCAISQNWLAWFSGYLLREPVWFIQALFLGGLGALFGVMTALFIQTLLDRLIPSGDSRMILVAGIILTALLLLRSVIEYVRTRFLIHLNRRIGSDLNRDFLTHLLRLPYRFFETRATGDLTARVADGMRIQQALIEGAGVAVIDGMILIGSIAFLFATAPPLGALAGVAIPLYALIVTAEMGALRRDHGKVMAAYAKVEGAFIDSFRSIEAIAGHGVSAAFIETNTSLHSTFEERQERLRTRQGRLKVLLDVCGGCLAIGALVWGSLLVLQGDLLVGRMIAGYTLLVGLIPSITRLVHTLLAIQEAEIAANRLRDLLLSPTEDWESGSPLSRIRRLEIVQGRVEWANGHLPFHEASLTLSQGEIVGLTGSNGAGKSTLARVLTRSVPLSGGDLLVNGIPAGTTSLAEYRQRVLLVPNEVRLVGGTLADNVLFGRSVTGVEVLEELIRRLRMEHFMQSFHARWATRVGEGGRRLSSGECQMIGIMRALLFPPDLLIIDEGIGSADEGNTSLVLQVLRDFSRKGMVLLISHDPRILASADRLYRFEGGKIVPLQPSEPSPHALRSQPTSELTPSPNRSTYVLP